MMYKVVIKQYGKERVVRVWAETLSDAVDKVRKTFYVDEEETRRIYNEQNKKSKNDIGNGICGTADQ